MMAKGIIPYNNKFLWTIGIPRRITRTRCSNLVIAVGYDIVEFAQMERKHKIIHMRISTCCVVVGDISILYSRTVTQPEEISLREEMVAKAIRCHLFSHEAHRKYCTMSVNLWVRMTS